MAMKDFKKLDHEVDHDDDMDKEPVVINDCVHGHIQLSRDLMRIVDTRQVQRLRDLKQLGLGSYVYPGATHTRFAHSIGACHLAGTFLRDLKRRQGLDINDRDIFCVEVAGLCHDLGHGPFSHMFEKAVNDGYYKDAKSEWKHEAASLDLFDLMVDEYKFEHPETGIFKSGETKFIKELIHSEEDERTAGEKGKEFLYEIVDNKITGLDVDKFDYFARDCHALGISNMFDHKRFILMARVLRCEDGKLHICHRDKELENLIIMFQTRFSLHMCAYKHPVVCALDRMVCDAFLHADKFMKVPGKDGLYALTESVKDPEAYILLSDSLLHRIRDYQLMDGDDKKSVDAAKKLIKRIEERKLYKLVHSVKNYSDTRENPKEAPLNKLIEEQICKIGKGKFDKTEIYIQVAVFDFGKKKDNPLKTLHLYSKRDPTKAFPFKDDMVSQLLLPKIFSEMHVRIYCKSEDEEKVNALRVAAEEWERQIPQAQNSK